MTINPVFLKEYCTQKRKEPVSIISICKRINFMKGIGEERERARKESNMFNLVNQETFNKNRRERKK